MGVGCSNPARSSAWSDFSESFRSAKLVKARHRRVARSRARRSPAVNRVGSDVVEAAGLEPPGVSCPRLGAEGEEPPAVDADAPSELLEPLDADDVAPDLQLRVRGHSPPLNLLIYAKSDLHARR